MQKTTCNTKDLINKGKRIVLTLSGWTSVDKLFPSCTLSDNLTLKTCEQNRTMHMEVHINGAIKNDNLNIPRQISTCEALQIIFI